MSRTARMRSASMRIVAAALILGTVAAGAVPAQAAAGDWKQEGFGAARTFSNPNESIITAANVGAARLRWSVRLPGECGFPPLLPTAPLVAGGRVFVPDNTKLGAYRSTTGRLLWSHTWPALLGSAHVAFSSGRLLAVTTGCTNHGQDNVLLALDPTTGAVRWQARTTAPMRSLVADRGLAVVSGSSASATPAVTAFRITDGARMWQRSGFLSSGVSAGGRILLSRVGAAGLTAVSATTGATLWNAAHAWQALAASPAGDLVYVKEGSTTLVCLRATNGSVVWRVRDAAFLGALATDGRRVYELIVNGFTARHARTGARQWSVDLGQDPGQPSLAGGLLYAKDESSGLAILNVTNGRVVAPGDRFGVFDEQEPQPPSVANGWLFLDSGVTGQLAAYAP
ncbi:PQQ-binding-like beta-propeller repeat protein [Krasilnikovia sp. MM14-A1259]|uniref:outer membrane protein assembly factor BamB family protein n=1 Tax=Krasilnikovia sp. MM14-A1259 TaxID=3373539 RepID=UPI003818BA14